MDWHVQKLSQKPQSNIIVQKATQFLKTKKDVLKRAWEIATKISKGPNLIYSSIKEVLRETENEKELPSFKILRSLETVKKVYGSHDLKEGASSFVKKTDPKWQDK